MFEVKPVLKIQQAVRICLLESAELVTSIVVTLVGLSCEEYWFVLMCMAQQTQQKQPLLFTANPIQRWPAITAQQVGACCCFLL